MTKADQDLPVLGAEDLRKAMQQAGIPGEIVYLDVPTPTVETAAAAVGVGPDQIVKTILFIVDGEPVIGMACGKTLVDRRVVAARYGVSRKKVKMADADTVLAETGYPVGGVPPLGHRNPIPVLMDHRVLEQSEVYGGGGEDNVLVRLNPEDIRKHTQAEVLDLHTPSEKKE